ncbi:hypothetical protein SCUP515_10538 [Seiridium cupressi]
MIPTQENFIVDSPRERCNMSQGGDRPQSCCEHLPLVQCALTRYLMDRHTLRTKYAAIIGKLPQQHRKELAEFDASITEITASDPLLLGPYQARSEWEACPRARPWRPQSMSSSKDEDFTKDDVETMITRPFSVSYLVQGVRYACERNVRRISSSFVWPSHRSRTVNQVIEQKSCQVCWWCQRDTLVRSHIKEKERTLQKYVDEAESMYLDCVDRIGIRNVPWTDAERDFIGME